MSVTKLPCGCKHDARRWLEECPPHKAENDAHHARALENHRKQEQEARHG